MRGAQRARQGARTPAEGIGAAQVRASSEALRAVVTTLFEDYGLHRIYAEADDRNLGVHRLLERLGFRCEARMVEADWFKDEWTSVRVYAILRREWEAHS